MLGLFLFDLFCLNFAMFSLISLRLFLLSQWHKYLSSFLFFFFSLLPKIYIYGLFFILEKNILLVVLILYHRFYLANNKNG